MKNFPRYATAGKLQTQKMQEMEQLANVQGLPPDRNTLNKLMALNPGLNNHINNNQNMVNRGALTGSAQAALALNNYQNILMRQNSMNSSPHSVQRDGSPFNNPNQNLLMRQNSMNSSPHSLQRDGSPYPNSNQSPSSSALQGASAALNSGSMQNSPARSSPHLPSQQQQQQQHLHQLQQRSLSANSLLQQSHSQGSQGNQTLQQQMIQQLLQDMSNNNGGVQPQSLGGPNASGNMPNNGLSYGGQTPNASGNMANNELAYGGQTPPATGGSANMPGNTRPVSRSNSFKSASTSDTPAAVSNNGGFNQRTSDMPQNNNPLHDVAEEFARELQDNPLFSSDLDYNMGFGWKA